jgi:two-component system NtrC family sensor kinase
MNMDEKKHKDDPFYKHLTRRIIFVIIFVSFTPLLLVSGMILWSFHHAYHEKVNAHLEELVGRHTQNIDSFLEEKLSDIQLLVRSYGIERLQDPVFLSDRLDALRATYDDVFTDLGVVNEDGIQVTYVGPFKLENADYHKAEWFNKALNNPYYISDVFLGLRGHPHFIVAVKQKFQNKDWIFRATINFQAFNSLVENLRIGQTGFAFILNKEGEFQTTPSFEFTPQKGCYGFFLDCGGETIVDDKVQVVEKTFEGGAKNLYATAFLKGGDWLMIFRQESRDAFAELNRTQNIAVLMIIMGGLVIVTLTSILTKRTVNRIIAADREKETLNQQMIETGKLATVGELAAGIAHEINNPVAIMVEEAGWIEDLLEEEDFKEGENLGEFERALIQIRTQGQRCKEITHKLLSFARKTDPRVHEVQLNALVEEMVSLSAQKAKYANVVLETQLAENLPTVNVSESEMQQVFLNLINNATDAMEKTGGTIRVTTGSEGDGIIIRVSDNGPGIPKANLDRIFNPFYTTKSVGKGTGLGLSICHGIIKKMDGEIKVESEVDVGTTFIVRIPLGKKDTDDSRDGNDK